MDQSQPTGGQPPLPPLPLLLLREKPGSVVADKTAHSESPAKGKGRKLVCRGCRVPITSVDARINVGGKHQHVFANPAGYLYELGCFSQAPGCANEGAPSWEFTWFPGHAWQIQVCRSCNALMGWSFRTPSGKGFYALILPHLLEENDEGQ
ncbi:MAG: hypothetical protein KKE73_15160 [Proteobacteria bacterium]|nr:hypothetical protein [Pseudomonadota bacterium]